MNTGRKRPQFFIIDRAIVSDTLKKVVDAKRALRENSHISVSEAVKAVDLSRSAFYKYKDYIFPFYEDSLGRNLTFSFDLKDAAGLLSKVLTTIAETGANILTINQTIPINSIANIVITLETTSMVSPIEDLFDNLKVLDGLFNFRIIARVA
ncbi:MAG: ACT domain-containing protein [Deltaproteobacteria bacterium]|nr:ACT domain-containing protein [Deltaproteobacteria bacterium]MBN2674152.1 ACT domain-containing protein [Deltaproteobacteria bacterium]